MKIMYYRAHQPNFGDELNLWMWPRILPGFFDEDETVLFIGIGSTIGEKYQPTSKKIVFGTGFVPEYHEKPDISQGDWDIYFVRGPRTAQLLGLKPEMALGDSAILLRTLVGITQRRPEVISFMPHWESLERGNWDNVCRKAGINLIDPRRPVEDVIAELLRSRLVITEAMHGAIVADAFRIPWIPLLPIDAVNREKWFDWAGALNVNLNFKRLWPSSLEEARMVVVRYPKFSAFITGLKKSPFAPLIEKSLICLAAIRLRSLAKGQTSLSADSEIERITNAMLEKVQQLRTNYPQ